MVGEPMPMLQHKVCMTVNIDISDTYTISGPVEVSVERFWRMVWENQIPTIVMLTQCTEAGKVWSHEKYRKPKHTSLILR